MSVAASQSLVPSRATGVRHTLASCPPLIGRGVEVARTLALLEQGRRLVTLLGPPGIGKTSLANWVAQRASARLPVLFCELSHVTDDDELDAAVLSRLGEADRELCDALSAAGPLLLVLDNFEQLVSAAPRLLQWLGLAAQLSILVTSRERLAIDGECVVELEPLALPDPNASDVAAADAVQLFIARAQDAGGRGQHDLPAIAEVVRLLDGIPLAIELAAARTRVVPPAILAQRIADGADLLELRKRTPSRHATLAHAIAWSWRWLDDSERIVLAACSCFAAGFSAQMAEAILGPALAEIGMPHPSVVERVAALREKSLIHVVGEDRLGLYRSIRHYAARRIEHDYAALVQPLDRSRARWFGEQARRFNRIRLLAAVPEGDAKTGDLAQHRGDLTLALERLERLPACPQRDVWRGELLSALILLGGAASERLLPQLRQALGEMAADQRELSWVMRLALHRGLLSIGDLEGGFAALQPVLAGDTASSTPAETHSLAALQGMALVLAGVQRRSEGDAAGAAAFHQHAAELIDQAPNIRPLAVLGAVNLACQGRLACDLRRDDEARRLNQQAMSWQERFGERWLGALSLGNLAQLEQERGQFARAESMLERAIGCFRASGRHDYEAVYASVCAGLYWEWDKLDLARRWFSVPKGHTDAISLALPQLMMRGGRAALEAEDDNVALALAQLEEARRAAARTPCPLGTTLLALYEAAVDVSLGRASGADTRRWQRWLAELDSSDQPDARVARTNLDARFASRMLQRAFERAATTPTLLVREAGLAFQVSGQEVVDLSRRGALRRIVQALAEEHRTAPGGTLDVAALVARGWPGQRILVNAAATRVRVAIATLRKLGLRDLLITRDDGYLLEPRARVRQVVDIAG